MSLPLSGMRIVAVEQYGAGPFGTMHLADLGAEVIKIENPDGRRRHGARGRTAISSAPGDSHSSTSLQPQQAQRRRSTSSMPRARRSFASSCEGAMRVFDNLRGDLPAKLGLTYAQLANVQPAHRLRSPLGLRPQRLARAAGRATII